MVKMVRTLLAAQVKQVAKKNMKYLFPPFFFEGPPEKFKAHLAGDSALGFGSPSFLRQLSASLCSRPSPRSSAAHLRPSPAP